MAREVAGPGRCGVMPIADGLCLRLLDPGDAAELHALIEANRAYLARWLRWAADQTLADSEDFVVRCRKQMLANEGLQAAVVRGGSIIGMAGFATVDWRHRSASIGYWLAEDHQGQGTMTATVRALLDHAFATWKLDRVEIRVATENRRSRAIPERLDFSFEGTLPKAELVGGRRLDLAVYALNVAERV